VDEVLAVGDADFQNRCLGKIEQVSKGGRTVLFVSHNMAAVRQLCNRGMLLHNGQIVMAGKPAECIEGYLTPFMPGCRIVDRIFSQCDFLVVQSVKMNGSESVELNLPGTAERIQIEIAFSLKVRIRVSLEIRLLDQGGNQVAIFSPGHFKGIRPLYDPGVHQLRYVIAWPRLTRGVYFISIYLTDPSVQSYVDLANAVRIHSEGWASDSGLVLDFVPGHTGPLVLDGQVLSETPR
jgi:lipopolysaccharide transport system ATP-binding protein